MEKIFLNILNMSILGGYAVKSFFVCKFIQVILMKLD
jgi:hypothetical protein